MPGKLASNEKKLLVRCVLDSYLNLRKLVIQRTNMVDDSQTIMLELLEDLTTGMFDKMIILSISDFRINIKHKKKIKSSNFLLCFFKFILFADSESETRSFMALCIEAIKKQDLQDRQTPQFIFERLANIIYPVSFENHVL